MKFLCTISILFVLAACTANPAPEDINGKLKSAMTNYLYKDKNADSSQVKYKIEKVVYYHDLIRKNYVCDFDVSMKLNNGFDTTGSMHAFISEDFTKVERGF